MPRLWVVLGVVVVAFTVYSVIDLLLTDKSRVRALPRALWFIVILIVPIIGAVLWHIVGKDRSTRGGARRIVAPDDDPTFLNNLRRDEEQEERIRRLEQELADLDDDSTKD